MPDWIHAILMIVIWIAVVVMALIFIGGLLGFILGVSGGYLIAGQIVQRIPGFWGEHSKPDRKGKKQ